MIEYDTFKVIDTDTNSGQMLLEWTASATPGAVLKRNHKIPLEAETNNWTEDQYRSYFALEIEDCADIPEWAKIEETNQYLIKKGLPPL